MRDGAFPPAHSWPSTNQVKLETGVPAFVTNSAMDVVKCNTFEIRMIQSRIRVESKVESLQQSYVEWYLLNRAWQSSWTCPPSSKIPSMWCNIWPWWFNMIGSAGFSTHENPKSIPIQHGHSNLNCERMSKHVPTTAISVDWTRKEDVSNSTRQCHQPRSRDETLAISSRNESTWNCKRAPLYSGDVHWRATTRRAS